MASRVPPARSRHARALTWIARRQYGPPIVESAGVYAQSPRLARWFALYNRAVERPATVSRRLLDLAALRAATVVECQFCIDIGSELARQAGLSDAQLLALGRGDARAGGLFSDDELLVLDYAEAMTRTPPEVTDEQVAALRARFGDRGTVELTHLIAWENARARTNSALGIGAGGFSAGRVCALPAGAAEGSAAERMRPAGR
jgi:AhpD family alkylhydroperoxidase